MKLPLIAIVGAPNVGKSTLFNRLVRDQKAIVTNEPGVTRDRIYGEVRDVALPFRVVDTGGLTPNTAAPFVDEIAQQAEEAMGQAACLLFVVDARAGVTATDREVVSRLRIRGLPLVLVANKIDSEKAESFLPELYELGLGDPVAVSAEHDRGIDDLLEQIDSILRESGQVEPVGDSEEPQALRIAIVGRPNVGKSSLLNRLAGEERAVVSDIPGTTRDAIDTLLVLGERRYRLVDTAGIRRRGSVRLRAERYSVARARRNIDGCDVAVLVLDATDEFAAQDAHIAGYVLDAYKPLVVAVNKWDLRTEREQAAKEWSEAVSRRLRFVKEAPLVLISARTGQRVTRVLECAEELYAAGGIEVPTSELNRWLQDVGGNQDSASPRAAKLFYATQTGTHPPSFVMFGNDPARIHFSYRRHLENTLRSRFSFGGTPIRLQFRSRR